MDWEQKTNWYMQSPEGYRISKASSKCPGQFAAWAPGAKSEIPALAYKPTAKETMQVCEDHFNNQRR